MYAGLIAGNTFKRKVKKKVYLKQEQKKYKVYSRIIDLPKILF